LGVEVSNLTKRFGTFTALDGVTFDVPDGKLLTLLGPSGSGKTTLLRCLAGVDRPDAGVIKIGSKVVFDGSRGVDSPPESRGIGMVFQTNALWPHMTVKKNVAYPLEIRGEKGKEQKVSEVLDLLKIGGLANRYPSEISGGEQQRVAIARAVVYSPSLVLLDEPFSNLDAPLRESLRDELRELQLRLGMAMVYVTHERVDALSLGDEMAILSEGRLMARGAPEALLRSPPNSYTAKVLGGMLVLDGTASKVQGGSVSVETRYGRFEVNSSDAPSGKVKLCVPPSGCKLEPNAGVGRVPGTFTGIVRRPSGSFGVRVTTESGVVEVHADSPPTGFKPGSPVFLSIESQKCLVLSE
jgi:iron(III) transport system ATP-binding protein